MRRHLVLSACAVLGLIAAGCGDESTTGDTSGSGATTVPATAGPTTAAPSTDQPRTTVPVTTVPVTTVPVTTVPPATDSVRAYFLLDEFVHVVGRSVGASTPAAAMDALLAGPTAAEAAEGIVTLVPAGTTLHGVTVADNEATVDLSAEFNSGGGSLSVTGRIAQVVFTVTQFDGIDTVRFSIDGTPVTELTGEGFNVDGVHRLDVADMIPLVLMETPWAGQTVRQPITVSGMSNTFEAQVNYEVVGVGGVILSDGYFMATSGTGTWGTFDSTLGPLPAGTTGDVRVRLFEVSAKDGEHISITEVTVHLA